MLTTLKIDKNLKGFYYHIKPNQYKAILQDGSYSKENIHQVHLRTRGALVE